MGLKRLERERGDAFGKGTLPMGYVAGIRKFAVSAEDSSGNMHTRLDLDVVDVLGQRRPGHYRALGSLTCDFGHRDFPMHLVFGLSWLLIWRSLGQVTVNTRVIMWGVLREEARQNPNPRLRFR